MLNVIARYRVDENNMIVRNEPRKKQPPTSKAQDFENYTGAKSAQRIAQKRAHDIMENANSWSELHNGLKKAGLRFEKKGSGAIVLVGDIAVKASSIDHQFSMGKLCKRLGEYQSGDYSTPMPKIEPEPLSKIAEKQWDEYKEVEKEIQRHSPPPANSADLAPKLEYIQRILDYAFGAQGDIWVLGQRLGKPEVEKFNKEAEIIDYYMKKPEQAASQRQSGQQRFRSR